MTCIGMDIGYSNLKAMVGTDEKSSVIIKPVGVVKHDDRNTPALGKTNDAMCVVVDGTIYDAGISPDLMGADYQRTLHGDYPSTAEYRALFHATLLMAATKEVDVLVTGLPVDQYLEPKRVMALERQLTGDHQVTQKKSVTVKKTIVVPQPIGGFMSALAANPKLGRMRTLVIDPGFFSVDWCMLRNNAVISGTLGTSLKASSVMLQECADIIYKEHGGRVSVEDIEQAVRSGDNMVMLWGEEIHLGAPLAKAAKEIAPQVMSSIKACIREVKSEVDAVLMVGGGGVLYQDAASAAFPRAQHISVEDAVAANAIGFWLIARG